MIYCTTSLSLKYSCQVLQLYFRQLAETYKCTKLELETNLKDNALCTCK